MSIAVKRDEVTLSIAPTLLDFTAVERVPLGVVFAPKVPVQLTWCIAEPHSVYLRLQPKPALAQWLSDSVLARECWDFGLELLTAGLDVSVGLDDVMITPGRSRNLIEIILDSGVERIGLRTRRVLLAEFVASVALAL
jgi:hypothetical protein